MKNLLLTLLAFFAITLQPQDAFARLRTKKIVINTDALGKIFVDGKEVGSGTTTIKVMPRATVNVRVEKIGFITAERNYINDEKSLLPGTDYIKLEVDDAYESSFITNLANQEVDLRPSKSEDEAWKLITRIITGSFDVILTNDKSTGYLVTAWSVKNFRSATIRTRLIVKPGNTDPLTYKIKLVSEYAPAGTSVNADEAFRPWDRVLRTFENVVPELQSRLTK